MQDKEHIFLEVPDDSPYLEHYGIKGMKWGVRKDGKPQGFQYGKVKKSVKSKRDAAKQRSNIRKDRTKASRNRSQLSEAELDRRIARLKKERELRQLTESEVKPGRTYVKDFLKSNGKKVAGPVAVGIGTYAIKRYMDGQPWNWADAARMIKLDKK